MYQNNFLHKKNFFIISVFSYLLKIFIKITNFIGFPKERISVPNSVLFIEPAHLGDVLLTTPAIRFLKENRRDFNICCLVSKEGKNGIENNNYIHKIETIELPWFKNKNNIFLQIIYFTKLVKILRKINPQIAFNMRNTTYHREHIAMWLAGIPIRIGYSHKNLGYLLSYQIPFNIIKQSAKLKLDIVSSWLKISSDGYNLKPDFFISKKADLNAEEILTKIRNDKDQILIAINSDAKHSFLWKKEYYIELCRLLHFHNRIKIIFTGTKDFEEYVNSIRNKLDFNTYSLVGKTTLEELAAVLKRVNLLITVDTGTRHLANAVGTKSLVLLHGASSINEFNSYVINEKILINEVTCSPCGKSVCPINTLDCMVGITPQKVFSEIKNNLKENLLKG